MNRSVFFLRWLSWIVAPVALFIPFFVVPRAYFSGNWDTLFYGNILEFTRDALASGQFLPHWLPDANVGFGSPAMLFYAPLGHLLTIIANLPFAFLHPDIDMQIIIGMYASQILSGLTSYIWLRRSFSDQVAFTASILFILLPYKFTYIYDHHNLAQLWSLSLLPLWMIAAEKMLSGNIRAIGLYALLFAIIYYVHSITIIAFGAVPAWYVLWFSWKAGKWRNYFHLALAHMLGIGMCLIYILPQREYLGWINEQWFWSGPYHWRENLYHVDIFLCAYYGIIALLVGYTAAKCKALTEGQVSGISLFWGSVIGIVAFMNLPVSAFIWERISVLRYLQFPAGRLHAAAFMGAIYLICVWLTHYKEMQAFGPLAYRRSTLCALILVFCLANIWQVQRFFAHPNMDQSEIEDIRKAHIILPLQYQTHWNCIAPPIALDLYRQHHVPDPVTVEQGNAEISSVTWQPPEKITFSARTQSDEALIMIRQCYFPLWQAQDEAGHPVSLAPDKKNGVLTLTVPKGEHRMTLTFTASSLQKTVYWICLFSMFVSLVLVYKYEKKYSLYDFSS